MMFKYEYTITPIGLVGHQYVCSVSFVEQQYEEDVLDLLATNDYHSDGKVFIPKHAVLMFSNLKGEFLSED